MKLQKKLLLITLLIYVLEYNVSRFKNYNLVFLRYLRDVKGHIHQAAEKLWWALVTSTRSYKATETAEL